MTYLDGLNEKQREAATHTEGPLLIVAGAGAGKTKTITHRIAHIIAQGTSPREILAVTFTNKAAGEMRERVERLVANQHKGWPLVATFHSLGVRILREFHIEAKLPRNFSIWDRDDSTRTLKKIIDARGDNFAPRAVLSAISRQKGEEISQQGYEASAKNFREKALAVLWKEYDTALSREGALDFDDLLLRTLQLLRQNEKVRHALQARWHYITIDEYQDTNRVQFELARLLADEHKNICVVGDIDQNIYSWRGADIEHLLNFEDTFPGAKVVTLEQNYRSTRTILSAANSVIEKNKRRKPKHLYTDNETGEALALFGGRNELDEAYFITAIVERLITEGTRASEIAVLYRENFQSRAIEEAFLASGISYRVLGMRFFERKEVKDLLSYLRAALNPQSESDITRIIAVPPRGIGKQSLEKVLAGSEATLPTGMRTKVVRFRETIEAIRRAIATAPAAEAIRFALEESGMETMFKNDSEEGHERLGNALELVNLAARYDSMTPPEGVERLLEEAALAEDQDALDKTVGAVSLMTMHASKGLEFDVVFVTGLEAGLFPSERDDADRDPEEERRLFYVALTRARKKVFLTFAQSRMKYGTREYTVPSAFLSELDPRLVAYAEPPSSEESEQIIT